MSYEAITRRDPNPVKRWVQGRRLADALTFAREGNPPQVVVDYGGGDGELAARAKRTWPAARVLCFEPAPALRDEAIRRLAGTGVEVIDQAAALPDAVADLVFCTEVFEHLPPTQTDEALDHLARVLKPGGRLIVGVPVEVGPPAFAKGVFRWLRRRRDFDARPMAILAAAAGQAPRPRLEAEIAPGMPYYPHHIGFDHRELARTLAERFVVERMVGSPFAMAPVILNSEAYILATKSEGAR